MPYRIPVATYRLQFNARFTFQDARRLVAYLDALGISDVYASPLLRARSGSTHGYDIVDALALNPELGTEDDLVELSGELDRHGMGMILDVVPNHMAASHENAWWVSVLENGPQSRYAHYFDIDWRTSPGREPRERLILPILGKPYGETLEWREIRLGFDVQGFFFLYYQHRLPLCPSSYPIVLSRCLDALPSEGVAIEIRDLVQRGDAIANSRFLKETLWRVHEQSAEFREALGRAIERFNGDDGDAESLDRLDELLEAQWYRLAYWRMASETINYRRFFDVTDLVGLRVENPEVFELRNRKILDLIDAGTVTGLRVDHIDGLFDPESYLTRLQFRLGDPSTSAPDPFYVVVEKILALGERMPASFRCDGTTGYDFLGLVNALLVDPAGLGALGTFYRSITGSTAAFGDVVYERKKQVIDQLFFGEMRALGSHLGELAVCDRNARDFAPTELLAALTEITACLPVYRTYVREAPALGADREFLHRAVAEARRRAGGVDPRLFAFLEMVLLAEPPAYIAGARGMWLEFGMRWQQFTGRVTAKGVEDTAFYNDHRLISLNEVGGEPGRDGFDPVAELHQRNERIARDWPHTMNATSTHDTKRSEDVRARIAALSGLPDLWQRNVRRWMRINAPLKMDGVPHPNEELLVYQTLAGMWPLEPAEEASVAPRLSAFLEKAAREAKTLSSWLAPDARYEEALCGFAAAVVAHEPFLAAFRPFQRIVAFHGFLGSLAQLVLKVCCPGIPDFYQGTELWDFSLVDPDNRRPVDYARRVAAMGRLPSPAALLRRWRDGRVKMFVTARALEVRARRIEAFRGAYRAVDTGTANAVAFLRGDAEVLVVVPRLTTALVRPPRLPVGDVWGDLTLPVPGRWRNAFTGEVEESGRLRELLGTFPVGVFEREGRTNAER